VAGEKVVVGNIEIVSVSDGQGDMSPAEVFPTSDIDVWRSEYGDLLDEEGLIHPRFGSFAFNSVGKMVLVDTGLGGTDGTLLAQLSESGVERDSVDLVVLTHIHPDHVGWNMSDGTPTFPNARYLVSRTDWDYWTQAEVRAEAPHVDAQMIPLESLNVLDLIDGEYDVTDEVKTLPTPGHTPGHISLMIASAGETAFILGDVAHSPAQAQYTDWSPGFDVDPDLARTTRHSVLDRLESDGTLVASGHFPQPGYGRFVRTGERRIWQPE
jgi:glyoxylase-like metal-dependent hydrolase (beta-lactamase superfamily II)